MADYFINAITRRVVFSGSAGVGPYAFTFEVLDENDVAVYKDSTKLTLTTDYTVTVNLNGTGSVTLVSAATSANTITILGARDIERVTDFVTAGDLRASAINEQLDALTIFDQQLAEEQKRTLMAPPYDPAHVDNGGTLNMTLPAAAARANSFLIFDAAGNPSVQAAGAPGAPTAVTRQQFSGDGSTVAFTLAADPGAAGNSLSVYISGVYQQRATYTVAGTTLTFSAAPPLGTNNIEVVNYTVGAIGATDASLVTYAQGSAGSVSRTVQNRLRETVSVKDFGAIGDGVTDDVVAIQAMATAEGYVRFPPGSFACSTTSVTVPIIFETGANLLVASGQTFTVKSRVESARQWIFRGDGDYRLVNDDALGIGEDSKQVHASWFGAFPSPLDTTDMAPFIQKAFDALGNLREGEVQFDNGNYHISSAMLVGRGIHVKGIGTRRTVFRLGANGFNVFTTLDQAVKHSNIQFEVQTSEIAQFDGAYIVHNHDNCEIYDVDVGEGKTPIVINNVINSRVRNIKYGGSAIFDAATSAIVTINGGSQHDIQQIVNSTSAGSTHGAIVRIGGPGALSSVSSVNVDGISYLAAVSAIVVQAASFSVSNFSLKGVRCNASSGTTDYAIKLITSGTGSIRYGNIFDHNINSQPTNVILLEQGSTGLLEHINLSDIAASGSTGVGVQMTRTAGTLREIVIASSVDVRSRATPFGYSGTMSNVRIDANAIPSALAPATYTYDVGNDNVTIINLGRQLFLASAIVAFQGSASQQSALIQLRAATTPSIAAITALPSDIQLLPSALTGTTGTVGKVTIGVQPNGLIYIENRTGASRKIAFTLFPTV